MSRNNPASSGACSFRRSKKAAISVSGEACFKVSSACKVLLRSSIISGAPTAEPWPAALGSSEFLVFPPRRPEDVRHLNHCVFARGIRRRRQRDVSEVAARQPDFARQPVKVFVAERERGLRRKEALPDAPPVGFVR